MPVIGGFGLEPVVCAVLPKNGADLWDAWARSTAPRDRAVAVRVDTLRRIL